MFKHILIPTDGSDLSAKAVKHGVAFAKSLGAKITALHVIPATIPIYYGDMSWVDASLNQRLRDAARAEGKQYLDRAEATARSANVPCESALIEADMVWQSIVDMARTKGCDLILMAAHGRRGLSALMLGSETNKVLLHSKIPVLVYR